ncbi:MAG: TrmB family transcriptional regulator [Oscillospiraceae bacterium]|jgi:sugar-specific transcriptional regulator TrmB|nr:TrmB family transcriptional regulator [Oscillospiraceae bacterium]MCI1991078.1 TrmB family transcriptional regulator [Oscillospiraceae bacterium]MCI2035449.1 TrmB family transcriptional regulator [Oscillospiraceae bacterium]
MDAAALLMRFGLTNQEARVYCTLCAEGELTGYEAAKATGISRSNIYTALAGLVEKGAACLSESAVTRYSAVPAEEFCSGRIASLQRDREELKRALPGRVEPSGGYLTVVGETNILNKMRVMADGARMRIYASMSAEIMERIRPELAGAAAKGRKVVLITESSFRMDGATVWHTEKKRRQIRLIVDSSCVLTGDIDDGEYSTCLYSKKKNLVDLFKEDLKNEIRLTQLTEGR